MANTSIFQRVKGSRPARRTYDKTHDNLFTTSWFALNPTLWECLEPGDPFKHQVSNYGVAAALAAPAFSRVQLKTRSFCVPVRKLIPNAEEFFGSSPSDGLLEPYTKIVDLISLGVPGSYTAKPGSLEDFIGVPDLVWAFVYLCNHVHTLDSNVPAYSLDQSGYVKALAALAQLSDFGNDEVIAWYGTRIRLLPFLAYQKIFHDWYTDLRFAPDHFEALYDAMESFQDYPYVKHTDFYNYEWNGGTYQANALMFLLATRPALYDKDYFTTCSDGQQQGPDLGLLPSRLDIIADMAANAGPQSWWQPVAANPTAYNGPLSGDTRVKMFAGAHDYNGVTDAIPGVGELYAQINDADQITPVKLRWQEALQRYAERNNSIGGKIPRYNDFVFGHFGVRVPDQFLQRSFFVGGTRDYLNINEVMIKADGTDGTNSSIAGEYVGSGKVKGVSPLMRGRVKEHCVYMTLTYIVPQNFYWQGLGRRLTNLSNLDWPAPELQFVGEEPVFKKELVFGPNMDQIFGYQSRYAWAKWMPDEIHGEFKSTLSYWHTGREFDHAPVLGLSFLEPSVNDGHDRILALSSDVAAPFRVFQRHRFMHNMPLMSARANGVIG